LESSKEKIAVVGVGPVGSLLSLALAKRGYSVEAFERRPDMRKVAIGAGRSINLAVSFRGLHALKEVGLEAQVLEKAIAMRGRLMHAISGELTYQPYGLDDSDCIYSSSRSELNKILMTKAEATGNVRIHFDHKVEDVPEFAHVIGTDGSASAMRRAMHVPSQEDELDYGYKELEIPAGPGGAFLMEKHALHIWPRGTFMLIALPNFEGSFTCTLFLPKHGCLSFDQLTGPSEVEAFFKKNFPDALALMPDLTAQFFANPLGHMPKLKCYPWNQGGKVLLMGDAAHAIVPFFGQGMNCGFEDVSYFMRMLETAPDWETLFTEFGKVRKPNADAIADMALENFLEMRDRVADPKFLLEKEVEKLLQKEFPGKYYSRYALVTFSRIPYREALLRGQANDRILATLCEGITSANDVDLKKAKALLLNAPSLSAH